MRARFSPAPSLDALVELTPHEVVRRFPESLAVFRRHGVDLVERGARPLRELIDAWGEDGGRFLLRELGRASRWRSPSGS